MSSKVRCTLIVFVHLWISVILVHQHYASHACFFELKVYVYKQQCILYLALVAAAEASLSFMITCSLYIIMIIYVYINIFVFRLVSELSYLAERCYATFSYCHKMSSVCRLSVTRVYCDKMAKDRIMRFSPKCSPAPHLFACQVW